MMKIIFSFCFSIIPSAKFPTVRMILRLVHNKMRAKCFLSRCVNLIPRGTRSFSNESRDTEIIIGVEHFSPVTESPSFVITDSLPLYIQLLSSDPAAAAQLAAQQIGPFNAENAETWKLFGAHLLESDWVALRTTIGIVDQLTAAGFSLGSFWKHTDTLIASQLSDRFGASVKECVALVKAFARIGHQSDVCFAKLIEVAAADEEIWIIPKEELVEVLTAFALSGRKHQTLFKEAGDRIVDELAGRNTPLNAAVGRPEKWELEELLIVAESYATLGLSHPALLRAIGLRITDELWLLESADMARVSRIFADSGFQHNSFFKTVCKEVITGYDRAILAEARAADGELRQVESREDEVARPIYSFAEICAITSAVKTLGLTTADSTWWAKAKDFSQLLLIVNKRSSEITTVGTVRGLLDVARALNLSGGLNSKSARSRLIGRFLQFLVPTQSTAYRSEFAFVYGTGPELVISDTTLTTKLEARRVLPDFLAALVSSEKKGLAKRMQKSKARFSGDSTNNLVSLCDWVCENVFSLTVSQVACINRSIAYLGFRNMDYFNLWPSYYQERLKDMTVEDVRNVKEQFNKLRMRDEDIGRDLFYGLGKRFQDLHVEGITRKLRSRASQQSRKIVRLG